LLHGKKQIEAGAVHGVGFLFLFAPFFQCGVLEKRFLLMIPAPSICMVSLNLSHGLQKAFSWFFIDIVCRGVINFLHKNEKERTIYLVPTR